ncbi:MAG: hypothetical protein KF799_15635 [Bdellovibrionales bacterium]|nr:hypothetical protein [Bdellovibrionales bacterium]
MQSSNVLVIGHPRPEGLDIGAAFVPSFKEARDYLALHQPSVLVFGGGRKGDLEKFCAFATESAPASLWIVASEGVAPTALIEWTNAGRVHDLIDSFEDPELEAKLQSALEAGGEQAQRRQLVSLFEDQSTRLKRLKSELESRVQKRHKTLRKTLRTLDETTTRMAAFHKALLGIHRASTVLQMEKMLNEALHGTVEIEWVRVRFDSQSSLKNQSGHNILSVELPYQYDNSRGEVMFAKAEGKRFSADEIDFLQELSEALALALARLQKLEQAETVKGQWQATFDSIPYPLCLVTADFEILKLNSAFQEACAGENNFRDLIGKRCFEVFFGREFQPPHRLDSPFTFRNNRSTARGESETYEVAGQRLGLTHDNQSVQLILLRPITEEVRYERRILEASKLAELGTIGSSIAHELNNPLGGMLSFLQLILMDMQKTEPLYSEIKAMESATLRCRDIIQNLLSFARKQDLGDSAEVDLWHILERSVKLIELQSRSKGIDVTYIKEKPALVRASSNALSQALCSLLQNSIDAITERLTVEPQLHGRIEVTLESEQGKYLLKISDNGTGIRSEVRSQIFNPLFTTRDPVLYSGMGLTTAHTIVSDHGGNLEILSQTGFTQAIVSLPRLDQSLD